MLGWVLGGAWLASMAALLARDVVPGWIPQERVSYRQALGKLEAEPRLQRLAIFMAGRRLGGSLTRYQRLEAGGARIDNVTWLSLAELTASAPQLEQLPAAGGLELSGLTPRLATTALLGRDLRLARFLVDAELGEVTRRLRGVRRDGALWVSTDGEAGEQRLPSDPEAMLGGLLLPGLFGGKLELGASWEVHAVDPFSGARRVTRRKVLRRERVVVAGEAHEAWVILSEVSGEPSATSWVDADGWLLREERGLGVRIEREALEAGDAERLRPLLDDVERAAQEPR